MWDSAKKPQLIYFNLDVSRHAKEQSNAGCTSLCCGEFCPGTARNNSGEEWNQESKGEK